MNSSKIKNLTYSNFSLQNLDNLALLVSKVVTKNFIIFLNGEIGTGKTTFLKFLAKHLKIKEIIKSNSYLSFSKYRIKNNFFLLHFDAYCKKIHLDEFFEEIDHNLTVIEWSKNLLNFNSIEFKNFLNISFFYLNQNKYYNNIYVNKKRKIKIYGEGKQYKKFLELWKKNHYTQ